MSNARRVALIAAISTVAVLTLGACAPAQITLPGGSGTGSPSTSASTAPTATPTPTAVAVAPPEVRVPLTCEQIAPAAQVTSVLGAPESLNTTDQTKGDPWLVSDLDPYAYVQDGARVCNYSTPAAADLTFYRAYIMPDASLSLWNPYFAQLDVPSKFNIQPSPFGAKSVLTCENDYHIFDCDLEMLVGSTWISLYGYSDEYPAGTIAATKAKFLPLFTTAVNAVKAATIAEPAWTDPAATTVNITSDPASIRPALHASIGHPATFEETGYGPAIQEATDDALIPVHYDWFNGGVTNYDLTVEVLPGGSWAWAAISAAASAKPNYTAITGLGDEAFSYKVVGGANPYEYAIVVSKGHNLFSVEVDTASAAHAAGALTTAMKAATGIAGLIS